MRFEPRNAKAITSARFCEGDFMPDGGTFVVSYVDSTPIGGFHVFVDSGKRYDWRFAAGLHACIVVKPGLDVIATVDDLFRCTVLYPTIVDYERQVVGSVVDIRQGRAKVQPWRKGSEPWRALFG